MNSGAAAWIMQFGTDLRAAVGQMELMHIIDNPEYITIPKAPDYCKQVIMWNDKIIPVIDLSAWFFPNATEKKVIVAITVYKDVRQDELKYGGIGLTEVPRMEQVMNRQVTSLPNNHDIWSKISVSCFISSDDSHVPILDVSTLFCGELPLESVM